MQLSIIIGLSIPYSRGLSFMDGVLTNSATESYGVWYWKFLSANVYAKISLEL